MMQSGLFPELEPPQQTWLRVFASHETRPCQTCGAVYAVLVEQLPDGTWGKPEDWRECGACRG